MKLRTSFFNPTVLKKDITRFAPVWGLYSVFLMLILMVLSDSDAYWAACDFHDFFGTASLIQLIYGGICAVLLFGDLFNPRMCNALHAMPLRREGWFLTHLTAGLLFYLVPTAVFCGLMLPFIGRYWYLSLFFFAISFLQFLFYFGVGAFSAMCAGNRLATVALYGIINFFSLFVLCLVYVFYEPFLYGIELNSAKFFYYSPALAMVDCRFVDFRYGKIYSGFQGYLADECAYLSWTALAGVLFLVLALLIYRRRNLETAGDFVSAKPAAPFFLVIFCLSAGMLLYILGDAFGSDLGYIFLAIGLVVGFFTGKMLLERTVKVFRPKVFLGFGALLLALALSIGAMAVDLLGIVSYVPKQEQVSYVTVYSGGGWGSEAVLTEPEDIQKILEFHEEQATGSRYSGNNVRIYLDYTLQDGTTLSRNYPIPQNSDLKALFRSYLSDWRSIFGTDDWEDFKSRISDIRTDGDMGIPKEAYGELLEAIYADCEAGRMAQDYSFHQNEGAKYWLDIFYDYDPETKQQLYLSLTVFENCINTVRVLNQYYAVGNS